MTPKGSSSSAAAVTQSEIMYGWTFHQSHDQATVLFLVPHSVSAKDLNIQIERQYIIAAVRPFPAIIKAKLYGRINSDSSTWRIDERDRSRSKRRSRSLTRSLETASSNEATTSLSSQPASGALRRADHIKEAGSDREESRRDEGSDPYVSPPRSQSSMTTSVASLRSGSSYEVVQHPPSLQQPQHVSPASVTGWSSDSSDFASSESADANLSRSVLTSDLDKAPLHAKDTSGDEPHRQSHTRSPSSAASGGHRSESSENNSERSAPMQLPPHPAQHGHPEARLVTLHLEKLDSGIWPFLVVGPAPLQTDCLSSRLRKLVADSAQTHGALTETFLADRLRDLTKQQRDRRQRGTAQLQLNNALVEALNHFHGGVHHMVPIRRQLESLPRPSGTESDEDLGPSTSSISINTISSDDSSTVLGSRVASFSGATASLLASQRREDGNDSDDDEEQIEAWKEVQIEAKFNMDPTTLSLIGLQLVNRRPTVPSDILRSLAFPAASGIPEAFEHFARSWRLAEIGLATERIVHDYLPLLPAQLWQTGGSVDDMDRSEILKCLPRHMVDAAASLPATSAVLDPALRDCSSNHTYMAQRQRLVASLGGPKALARLYLSYGRLRLPSLAESRSPLAFPYGQLTSPFVSGRDATLHRQVGPTERAEARKPTSVSGSSATSFRGTANHLNRGATSPILKGADAASSPKARTNASQGTSPFHSPPAEMTGGGDFTEFFFGHEQSSELQPGPFFFLLEACLLDEDVSLSVQEEEWAEALHIALMDEKRIRQEMDGLAQAEEMGSLAGGSQSGCLAFDDDDGDAWAGDSVGAGRPGRGAARRRRSSRRDDSHETTGFSAFFPFLHWSSVSTDPNSQAPPPRRRRRDPRHRQPNHRQPTPTAGARGSRSGRGRRQSDEDSVRTYVTGASTILAIGVALAAGSVAALNWYKRTSALTSNP